MSSNKNHDRPIVIERRLLESKAYRDLSTPTAYVVFGIFYTKRQMEKQGRRGKEHWIVANNGEIVFTYQEAKTKHGISCGTFRKAIDELRSKGFIDIAESGVGLHKSANLYSISERWRLYGTEYYRKPKPRSRTPINKGFQKGNRYGRNCRK